MCNHPDLLGCTKNKGGTIMKKCIRCTRVVIFMVALLLSILVYTGTARAFSIWDTVVLNPGEKYSVHNIGIELTSVHTWKTINWLTLGQVAITQQMTGTLHLEPGQTSTVMHANSDNAFFDEEWFTNSGTNSQTLTGTVQVDAALPPVGFGPVAVLPGESGHVTTDVNVPDPITGTFDMWKEITNVDTSPNWWDVTVNNTWNTSFIAGGTFSDHHFFETLTFTGEWFEITNTGTNVITFDFHYEMVPEPSTLLLLGTGIASLIGYHWRRRRRVM